MKKNLFVEFAGKQVTMEELEKQFRDHWKSQNRLIKDIETLNVYYNVDSQKCYFVVNGEETIAI